MATFPCPTCGEELNPADEVKEGVFACGACWKHVEVPALLTPKPKRPTSVAPSVEIGNQDSPLNTPSENTELAYGLLILASVILIPVAVIWAIGGWLLIVKVLLWIVILVAGAASWFYCNRYKAQTAARLRRVKVSSIEEQEEQEELTLGTAVGAWIASVFVLLLAAVVFRGLFLGFAILTSISVSAYFFLKRSYTLVDSVKHATPYVAATFTLLVVWYAGRPDVAEPKGPVAGPSSTPDKVPPRPERVMVIVVPGTFGNSGFWSTVSENKVSFASEVISGLGEDSTIYPFVWAAPNSHQARVEAARNLAEIIDEKASEYDRVCLIGHSHGGNVALLAAANTKSPVDSVICLSTPHIYLKTKDAQRKVLLVPVYCPLKTFLRVRNIVCISPDSDSIVEGWADVFTGLTENDAIGSTRDWLELLGSVPKLVFL